MKKIAICFSGHLRNFISNELPEFTSNVGQLIDSGYQVDCFFSVWDTYNTGTLRNSSDDYGIVDINELRDQLKLLNVKSIEIENYNEVKHNFYLKNFHPIIEAERPEIMSSDRILYSTPMFYKMHKCNLLKKNYESEYLMEYDIVIRYRANIKLINPLTIAPIKPNTIYNQCPNNNPYPRGLGYTHESLMTFDMFFYTTSPTMDVICNLYSNLATIITNHGSTGPERILYDWCFLENKLNQETTINQISYAS